jgi:hypothetical protein
MSRVLLVWLGLCLFTLAVLPSTALAQDHADAVKLFQEGRDAIDQKDYNVACAKFEQSHTIDPRVGTLLNLGLCEEARGRLVRALEIWKSASDLAKRLGDDRAAEADRRAAALDPRIPTLSLVLPVEAPPTTEVRVELDTLPPRVLTADEVSQPVRVDPGTVTIVVAANGGESRQEVEVAEGTSQTVALVVPEKSESGASSDGGVNPMLVAGIVVGAVGLVGLGVGFGFGSIAVNKRDESRKDDHCKPLASGGGYVCDTQADLTLNKEAQQAADISTGLVVAGGIVAALGITLVVISVVNDDTSSETARLQLGVSPTSVTAQLHW